MPAIIKNARKEHSHTLSVCIVECTMI